MNEFDLWRKIYEYDPAFIVRAVNAHEGLVRALELFLAEFDDEDVQKRTPIAYYKAVDAARAALSAAKE